VAEKRPLHVEFLRFAAAISMLECSWKLMLRAVMDEGTISAHYGFQCRRCGLHDEPLFAIAAAAAVGE
jgi:hypothetical protein